MPSTTQPSIAYLRVERLRIKAWLSDVNREKCEAERELERVEVLIEQAQGVGDE